MAQEKPYAILTCKEKKGFIPNNLLNTKTLKFQEKILKYKKVRAFTIQRNIPAGIKLYRIYKVFIKICVWGIVYLDQFNLVYYEVFREISYCKACFQKYICGGSIILKC